jgi:hypothetical protein
MEKDLFAIFPDLPWPGLVAAPLSRIPAPTQHPHPPATQVARRGIPNARHTQMSRTAGGSHSTSPDQAALRRIREIAGQESERLTRKGHLERVLQTIIAIAEAATTR